MDDEIENTLKMNSGNPPKTVGPIEPITPIVLSVPEITEVSITDVNDVSTEIPIDVSGGSCDLIEVDEPFPKKSVASWDDVLAKTNLLNWAKSDSGNVSKKSLMKWFLDVDGGPAQDISAYRYPVGVVDKESGIPRYCPVSMDHSWSLADGSKTGISNRAILRKIVFLKNREGFPLTAAQDDFVSRHMSDTGTSSEIDPSDDTEGIFGEDVDGIFGEVLLNESEMRYNSAPISPGIIEETEDYIDVSVIPMREGVFTGTDGIPTLKLFDEFKNDAHWIEGQPILHGHTGPTEIVTYQHNRLGKIRDVKVRPDTKDVSAIARYYKQKITPEKLSQLHSGKPFDGSIAYTTHTVPVSGDWIAPDGKKIHYNAVEKDGYHFYHFAEVNEGACSVSNGCGFLLNEHGMPDSVLKFNGNFWEPAVNAYLEKLNSELIMSKDDEVESKRLKSEIDKWSKLLSRLNGKQNEKGDITLNSFSEGETQSNPSDLSTVNDSEIPGEDTRMLEPLEAVGTKLNSLNDLEDQIMMDEVDNTNKENAGKIKDDEGTECFPFQMKDGICQKPKDEEMTEEVPKENSVQVEVTIPEEFTQKMNAAISENESLKSALADQTQKLNEMVEKVDELIQKQNELETVKLNEMARKDYEAFSMQLNAANSTPEKAKQHYEAFKDQGWSYLAENPKILRNTSGFSMKAMGVASSAGVSDLENARRTLKKTLSGKA